MSSKTDLWDRLGKTDPAHTKPFQRAGGFKGTAIKPIWSIRRMTEEFGPCGVGWGMNEPTFQVVHAGDEVLVYCTVSVWHGSRENIVFGVGGDKVVGKNKYGTFTDDEAFKKAFTDALTNAFKEIGLGADVHMGMFDDNKYVNAMRDEFRQTPASEEVIERDDGIPVLLVKEQRPIFDALVKEMWECKTPTALKSWRVSAKPRASRLSDQWVNGPEGLNKLYKEHMDELQKQEADEYIERKTA